ncbi:MAG TPA: shikimate dehydrogenase, partial [Marmoricola sp.]|nr:shikimate dehydrogenase [Marmoricola sp.]
MAVPGAVRRCAVLGQPIAHSLSPVLHRAAYAELGLDWQYDAVEVGSDGLAAFLEGLGAEWRGLSLTMPLKRTVLPMLDSLDRWASLSAAANTV